MRINFDHLNNSQISSTVFEELTIFNNFNSNNISPNSITQDSSLILENARTSIANTIDVLPGELVFTSDEYQTYQILFKIWDFIGIKQIIISVYETDFVLNSIDKFAKEKKIKLSYIENKASGKLDLKLLEDLLSSNKKTLIHLPHLNLYYQSYVPTKKISKLCKKQNSYLSLNLTNSIPLVDTSLQKLDCDFAFFASSQIHGLGGVHALYIKHSILNENNFKMLFNQSKRQFNSSNIVSIKAFEIAFKKYKEEFSTTQNKINELKRCLTKKIKKSFKVKLVNLINDENTSTNFSILSLPFSEYWIQKFDIKGISISNFANMKFHKNTLKNKSMLLLSFSKYNTLDEINYFVKILDEIVKNFDLT